MTTESSKIQLANTTTDQKQPSEPKYYINEAGLKIDAITGNLLKEDVYPGAQCLAP